MSITNQIPLKVVVTGTDTDGNAVATVKQFEAGDVLPVTLGGTGSDSLDGTVAAIIGTLPTATADHNGLMTTTQVATLTDVATNKIDTSHKAGPSVIADQIVTVTSLTAPTPAYKGQIGRDSSGQKYVAISTTGSPMWEKAENVLLGTLQSFLNAGGQLATTGLQDTSVTGGKTSFIVRNKNLFVYGTCTQNFYVSTNGNPTSATGYLLSDYIPVLPSTNYFRSAAAGNYQGNIACYDAGKTFIPGGSGYLTPSAGLNSVFTTPVGCYYIRINVANSSGKWASVQTSLQIEQGSSATSYVQAGWTLDTEAGLSVIANNVIPSTQSVAGSMSASDKTKLDKIIVDANYQLGEGALQQQSVTPWETTFIIHGKNLFNKDMASIGYFVDHTNGTLVSNASYDTSDYMRVTPGVTYVGSDGTHRIRKVAYYDVTKTYLTGSDGDMNTFTPPAGAIFARYSCYHAGLNSFQLEVGSTPTDYEAWYQKLTDTGSNKVTVPNTRKIGIDNSSKVVLIGDSYSAQYNVTKGKAWIAYLSMFSDWNFENYALSGADLPAMLARIVSNAKIYHASYGIQDYNGTYALIMSFANDYTVINDSNLLEVYLTNMRKVIEAVKSLGMVPIICTEYHNQDGGGHSDLLETSMRALANEYGIVFADILAKVKLFKASKDPITPAYFWAGSHPGVRTNTLFWANLKRYIDALPRPRQGIKIYRKRTQFTISTIADLFYKNILDRAVIWKEILVSQCGLDDSNGDEKYFDDQDVYNGLGYSTKVYCDYLNLRAGSNVAFTDYALIEAILPTRAHLLSYLALNISDATATVYVRDMVNQSWVSVTNSSGKVVLPSFIKYVNYDKVSFLVVHSGAFNLNAVSVDWDGQEHKDYNIGTKPIAAELSTPELLSTTDVTSLSGWTQVGSLSSATPYDSVLPAGLTKETDLTNAAYLTQAVTFAGDAKRIRKLQIKAWVRFLPAKFSYSSSYPSASWQSEDTYDLAQVNLEIRKDAKNIVYLTAPVGLHWHEVFFEVDVPLNETGFTLAIRSADTKAVQFAYASVKISA
jgi:hypothetical protein